MKLSIITCCNLRCFIYRYFFSDNTAVILDSKIIQATQYAGRGRIKIVGASLGIWPSPSLLTGCGYVEARSPEAMVEIKQSTFINNSFVIIADRTEVKIGENCLIGPNFFVSDSDFHGLGLKNRFNGNYECSAVVIEDNVFIGDNVRVLKGVKVGHGAVIGSGSVVVGDVEPMSIYAGVPARFIRHI